MRVRDMSRKQQKAVFANLGASGSSTISNSDRDKILEKEFPKKRKKIKIPGKLSYFESVKIRGKRLQAITNLSHADADLSDAIKKGYKPDINRIKFKIKKERKILSEANKKLGKSPTDTKGTYYVFPEKDKKPITFERGTLARAERDVLAKRLRKKGIAKEPFALATYQVKRGAKVKDHEVREELREQKAAKSKQNKNYRVVMVIPAVGTQKSEFISSEIMTKKQAEILVKEKKKLGWKRVTAVDVKKDLSYKQLKKAGIKLKPGADADSDGVKNSKDCKPFDKTKQDLTSSLIKSAEKTIAAYQESRTPKARIKKAKEKLAKLKRKEKAEKLESELKEKEQAYKKAHPKRFGMF